MKAPRRDVTGANTALSFIDVLASALGAAVLLFVILASTPVSVAGRAQAAGGFIRYEWTISDPAALLRLSIRSPSSSGGDPRFIDLKNFDGETVSADGLAGVSSYLLMGFAAGAEDTESRQSGKRTYVLRLNQPEKGVWQVGVLYYDRADSIPTGPSDIQVTTSVCADSDALVGTELRKTELLGKESSFVPNDAVSLSYGDELLAPAVEADKKKGGRRSC
ncbi:hypothetical protein RQ479_21185 [Mesorhizobium sp. ISC25]|uniref:hypothetical protein n=1 Tax=Mesorhizobium sp. ISC25 TaxID=3077335 RepID=UPI0035D5921B